MVKSFIKGLRMASCLANNTVYVGETELNDTKVFSKDDIVVVEMQFEYKLLIEIVSFKYVCIHIQ